MAARTPTEAVEAFFDPLQRAVSVVTPSVLVGRAYRAGPVSHDVTLERGDPVALGRDRRLRLSLRHRYVVATAPDHARAWSVRTVGYLYELLDADGRGVVSYHWHPEGRSPVTTPHLHVAGRISSLDISRAHLPTGRVSLVAILRLTIADLGVQPLLPAWSAVLDRAEQDLAATT